ncbi:hypothetical protein GJ744_011019 [Endocarpon pusillum]|uniref:Meiotic recombination protein DMC1 n=1 Tax=Endocarpon pusillum TaxID=364733 RepID=A0A8H7E363_9EURO|nr:hypothetical protein GJ744_011019 [Endocarpon pusillum]
MEFVRNEGQSLPSPAPSSSLTAITKSASSLPTPRHYPLKPGSQKEIAFINYVDSKILHINRRYAKKFSSGRDETDEEARGYDDFENAVEDLEHVLDAIWVSGTPTLQIPYLLSLAGLIAEFLPSFPFNEGPTMHLVDKMDQAFAILLSQRKDSTVPFASDASNQLVSVTDRVRIRSVIESTRVIAVEASTKDRASADTQDASEGFTESEYEELTSADSNVQSRNSLNMSISRMYERSLSILGDSLG